MTDERVTSTASIITAASSFLLEALPFLQVVAVVIAIFSGLLTIRQHLRNEAKR